jgi:dihydrodipicolinate synthase/N-acetylneuraminate lyase
MAPELWVEIWQAYQDGDLKRAETAQDRATEVTKLVRRFGLHATTKAVLSERLGIDCGDPRPPGLPLTAEQRQQVLARAAELGLTRVTVSIR